MKKIVFIAVAAILTLGSSAFAAQSGQSDPAGSSAPKKHGASGTAHTRSAHGTAKPHHQTAKHSGTKSHKTHKHGTTTTHNG